MVTAWEVILTNRETVTVNVPSHLPEHRQAYVAMYGNPNAFSARPVGCNGIAYNAHAGWKQWCPVHATPNEPENTNG